MEKIKNLAKKLVVANDAGASYQIFYFLKYYKLKTKFYLSGQATKIFNKKNYKTTLKNSIKNIDLIITGTGWQTNLEVKAIKLGLENKIKTVSFVDSPHNLKLRFSFKKKKFFPNIIFVKDNFTKRNLKLILPKKSNTKIIKIKDFYLNKIKKKKYFENNNKLLYLSSNFESLTKKHSLKKINDFKLLKIFISKIRKINRLKNCKIFLKTHPSENRNKYNALKEFKNLNINFINTKNITNIKNEYQLTSGTETYGLAIAKKMGFKVLNNIKKTGFKETLNKIYNIKSF